MLLLRISFAAAVVLCHLSTSESQSYIKDVTKEFYASANSPLTLRSNKWPPFYSVSFNYGVELLINHENLIKSCLLQINPSNDIDYLILLPNSTDMLKNETNKDCKKSLGFGIFRSRVPNGDVAYSKSPVNSYHNKFMEEDKSTDIRIFPYTHGETTMILNFHKFDSVDDKCKPKYRTVSLLIIRAYSSINGTCAEGLLKANVSNNELYCIDKYEPNIIGKMNAINVEYDQNIEISTKSSGKDTDGQLGTGRAIVGIASLLVVVVGATIVFVVLYKKSKKKSDSTDKSETPDEGENFIPTQDTGRIMSGASRFTPINPVVQTSSTESPTQNERKYVSLEPNTLSNTLSNTTNSRKYVSTYEKLPINKFLMDYEANGGIVELTDQYEPIQLADSIEESRPYASIFNGHIILFIVRINNKNSLESKLLKNNKYNNKLKLPYYFTFDIKTGHKDITVKFTFQELDTWQNCGANFGRKISLKNIFLKSRRENETTI